jgi:hypothetical protein
MIRKAECGRRSSEVRPKDKDRLWEGTGKQCREDDGGRVTRSEGNQAD